MILLILFSFLAGLITILSPCILSILPILLATTSKEEKYRPIGIMVGLITSFSFFTLATTSLVQLTGISPDIFRYIAIGTIIFFGLTMIIPSLETWVTTLTARITQAGAALQKTSETNSTGFISGCILGAALGLIWTPCAGPILATITVLASTQDVTLTTLAMIVAYSFGAALPMILFMYGGNAIINASHTFAAHMPTIRKIFGILMIISSIGIAFNLDTQLRIKLAKYFPNLSLEDNTTIKKELEKLKKGHQQNMKEHTDNAYTAPELTGISSWINTQPLSLNQLRGKVILLDFWTYSCINCIRTLPHVKKWYSDYKDYGFEIIGVHTPEFAFEKNVDHVHKAVEKFCLTYPIALDNNYATWQAYDNHYWPAHYLINQQGTIVYHHFGEGNYQETENHIRHLLGLQPLIRQEEREAHALVTPETYLGCAHADRYHRDIVLQNNQTTTHRYTKPLSTDQVGLTGPWLAQSDRITSTSNSCTLDLNFMAHTVNLVMESPISEEITILLDGKPLLAEYYTSDTNTSGTITVHEPRMYEIINLKNNFGRHILSITFPQNISAYVFTFG
jgi:cytochrome c biogenesis protein CcdA/thiol-disulfide isomerase/thioredoxin